MRQVRGFACCLLAKPNGVPLKATANGIVAIAMVQDLKPFTDELPRDVVPLDAVHPRNPEALLKRFGAAGWKMYACVALMWFSSAFLRPEPASSFPWAESVALFAAWGLGYFVWLRRTPVPWTGTFKRFRVQRGSKRLIMVDPLWPRRWGPTFETLSLPRASKVLLRPEFDDAAEAPAGYRENATAAGMQGEPVRIQPRPASNGAVRALCVAAAILIVALVFFLAPLELFAIRTPLLCVAVVLGMFAFVSGDGSCPSDEYYSIEDGCLCRHGSRPFRLPLDRVIAISVAGEDARLWLREGSSRPAMYRIDGSGVDVVKALFAESTFLEGAPLQFNDHFSKSLAILDNHSSRHG